MPILYKLSHEIDSRNGKIIRPERHLPGADASRDPGDWPGQVQDNMILSVQLRVCHTFGPHPLAEEDLQRTADG